VIWLQTPSSLARWKNHFSQLLNVGGINDVRQTEFQQSLVPEPSAFEGEMAIKQVKVHKSPGVDQMPAELIKAGGRKNHSEMHKLFYLEKGGIA